VIVFVCGVYPALGLTTCLPTCLSIKILTSTIGPWPQERAALMAAVSPNSEMLSMAEMIDFTLAMPGNEVLTYFENLGKDLMSCAFIFMAVSFREWHDHIPKVRWNSSGEPKVCRYQ
jgi:hypothetical protein